MADQPTSQPSPVQSPRAQHYRDWSRRLHQQLRSTNHRAAVVICADKHRGRDLARWIEQGLQPATRLYLSNDMAQALPVARARTQLGLETELLVFDACDAFDVDALGALGGTLCGGGLLLLLLPDTGHWPELARSRFLKRALGLLEQHKAVYILRPEQSLPALDLDATLQGSPARPRPGPYRTDEQQQVVEAIEQRMQHPASRPLVLVSDRGRGKSSALGLAAARLLHQGLNEVLVTAPRLASTRALFHHAAAQLSGAISRPGEVTWREGRIRFIAPDALLQERPRGDVLMVDEAAAIPLSMLEAFLAHYAAIVFATTVHGYEGTGRGFALKFNRVLDRLTPGWQLFTLQTPVRWGADDPLEDCLDALLGMQAELGPVPAMDAIDAEACELRCIDRDVLSVDEGRLSALFALLVGAHYRTQPSDLRHMLDDEQLRVYVLEHQGCLLGAALVNREGGFDPVLSEAIYRGDRRPRGHLLPQTLCFHAGFPEAAGLNYARIMRIAIHPDLQGQGLGSRLLAAVVEQERGQSVDAIGTSFGATPELMRFWGRGGFQTLRMGFTRDHASGTHSAVMVQPFSQRGTQLFEQMRLRFRHYLPAWLGGPLADLPDDMRAWFEPQQLSDSDDMRPADWQEVRAFAHSHRGVDACLWPLVKLVKSRPARVAQLDARQQQLIRGRLLEQRSWHDVVAKTGVSGRAQAVRELKQAVAELLQGSESES